MPRLLGANSEMSRRFGANSGMPGALERTPRQALRAGRALRTASRHAGGCTSWGVCPNQSVRVGPSESVRLSRSVRVGPSESVRPSRSFRAGLSESVHPQSVLSLHFRPSPRNAGAGEPGTVRPPAASESVRPPPGPGHHPCGTPAASPRPGAQARTTRHAARGPPAAPVDPAGNRPAAPAVAAWHAPRARRAVAGDGAERSAQTAASWRQPAVVCMPPAPGP
jgi:hypothetical protein